MKKNWTGERLETFIYSRDAIEHLHRYAIVSDYIKDKIVLDIACGEGYGSNILAEKAKQVYGVDIDNETINTAKKKYKKHNLQYSTGDASKIPFDDGSIDVVVSFETIEHHEHHNEMMSEIKRVLRPNGIVIISTPDKYYYSDLPKFQNKFHVKELYKEEFLSLIEKYFSNKQILTQEYHDCISVIDDDNNFFKMPIFTGDYKSILKKETNPLYLIAIASNDNNFERQKTSLFEGSQIIVKQAGDMVYNSNSFKIGNLLLSPIKFLKKMF